MYAQTFTLGILALLVSACSPGSAVTPTQPNTISIPLQVSSAGQHDGMLHQVESAHNVSAKNQVTHLKGDQEVFTPATPTSPTPADSHAQGQAIFHLSEDGQSFDYKLIASNIDNVVQAHIHCGTAGSNGPIVVWLFPDPTATTPLTGPTGPQDGVLAENTILSSVPAHVRPVLPGASAACPGGVATFADVLEKMRTGGAYVNVHTNDGVAPTNTGPGDFPGGEMRGQL